MFVGRTRIYDIDHWPSSRSEHHGVSSAPERDHRILRNRKTSTPKVNRSSSCEDDARPVVHRRPSQGTAVLEFTTKVPRKVCRGKYLGHSVRGSTVFAGMDTVTGELVTVTEWVLKWRHVARRLPPEREEEDSEAKAYLKQITSIEQELLLLLRLKHANLVHYLGLKYEQEAGKITVYVLSEYCGGGNLDMYLRSKTPVPVELLRLYTEQILQAIDHLHSEAVVHKNIRASSVLLDDTGSVRLTDYSIQKRLSDLYESVENQRPGVRFTGVQTPVIGRGGKKGDIYQLGLLLLSLADGQEVTEILSEIPAGFSPEFQDFLSKCLIQDERHRWSAGQLLDHSFVRHPVPTGLNTNSSCVASTQIQDVNKSSADIPMVTSYEASGQSRLKTGFVILKSLGKGGFGDVIKVRNKLDGRYYAIKRIPLNPKSKQFNKKITHEVKLLSRLNHENVVRYYNSWIETSDDPAYSDDSSNDDDDDDENDVFGAPFVPFHNADVSDGIEFEGGSVRNSKMDGWSEHEDSKLKEHNTETADVSEGCLKVQYLYIQMEYCDKSTLRNCIDAGLYEDMKRVWRLFREIVEGLTHIHKQGMIHRDLKPVNIFLDSNDQVKIGDFGLATIDVIVKKSGLLDSALLSLSTGEFGSSRSGTSFDSKLTGNVGTALYVSPEMMKGGNKASYNQKVDIYSLGIIFFEMCYRPLGTGMERVKILTTLRQEDVKFPEDFDELSNQAKVLRLLLNHDPSQRPSSQELLQSDYLPPPLMEEAELNEVLRSTISNPQSKTYRHMISAMLCQPVNPATDLTYDMDDRKMVFSQKAALIQQQVCDSLTHVFQRHGAVRLATPLLIPRSSSADPTDQHVYLMDHSGGVVSLQYDLRVPFARYVARNNIHSMKRYFIDHVYREKKPSGLHPKQLTECAFDIVSTTPGSFIPDAEILEVVQEIITEFPPLQSRNYYIRVNHTLLLQAILSHCGITEDKHEETLLLVQDILLDKQKKPEARKILCDLSMSEHLAGLLIELLEFEGSLAKVSSKLRCITKTKGEAGSLAKQGLHEIDMVLNHAHMLGMKMKDIVTLGLHFNCQQYSGVVFQVMSDVRRKKRVVADILAAGGRYNKMISQFHTPMLTDTSTVQHGVGVSVAFDKVVNAMIEYQEPQSASDILVCTIGHKAMLKERLNVVRDLWSAGLRAEVLYEALQTLEDIQERCKTLSISHIVILKDSETGHVKVRSVEKDKVTEKKVNTTDLVDYLHQKLRASRLENGEGSQTSSGKSSYPPTSQNSGDSVHIQSASGTSSSSVNNFSSFNFTYIPDEHKTKQTQNMKKKYETQIFARLTPHFGWMWGKVVTEVIALDLGAPVLRSISGYLNLEGTEAEFQESVSAVMERQPRYRKYLTYVIDHIHDLKFTNERKTCVIILYGIKDDSFKLLG
ncbi:eIF-2-alpha kinase GCN2-like [Liolophura sinensis]|uniref:eIF-2-alpha kinase GCN2-like n=1 Tax=Liolophura sinensis TaxID=3198878 RepID=UPI0031595191